MKLRKSTLFEGEDMNSYGNVVSPPRSGRVRRYGVSDGSCEVEGNSVEDGVSDGQRWHGRWYGSTKGV